MMHLAFPLSIALMASAAGQSSRADAGGDPGDELDRAIEILERLDRVTASVNYLDEPLADVIEDLNWKIDVPLSADWEALIPLGVDRDSEITLRLEDAPLSTVLAAVTLKLGDGFDRPCVEVFKSGMLVLTAEEATADMQVTDVYDVRDLLTDDRAVAELRRTAPSGRAADPADETSSESAGASGDGANDGPAAGAAPGSGWRLPERPDEAAPSRERLGAKAQRSSAEELMSLIAEHVDPEAWIGFGGTRASITDRGGVVMVTAAPTLHRAFRAALSRLRRVYAPNVAIEAAVVEIPREIYARLTRRHERSSAALGRSIVASRETRTIWRAASGITMERPLAFESRDDAGEVSVDLTAHLDRAAGLLLVDVEARSHDETRHDTVKTTVTIPYRQGGATVEFPGRGTTANVRLLLLIPVRE